MGSLDDNYDGLWRCVVVSLTNGVQERVYLDGISCKVFEFVVVLFRPRDKLKRCLSTYLLLGRKRISSAQK